MGRARRAEEWLGAEGEHSAEHYTQEQRHPRRLVRFGLDLLPRAARQSHDRGGRHDERPRGRPLPRGPRPAPRLVPLVAADRLRDRGPCALPRPADARLHGRRLGPQDEQEPRQLHRRCRTSAQKLGAEIIRLWCAATDYSGDLGDRRQDPGARRRLPTAASATRCASCSRTPATSTQRGRGAARADARDRPLGAGARGAVPGQIVGTFDARGASGRHYEVYEFHPVVAKLQVFCSEDLGAFYLDVLKDRLYTTAPKSLARRSRADRAVAHHARDAALDGAVPELHRRGGVEGVRAGAVAVDLHRDLLASLGAARRGAARQVGAHPRESAPR